LNTGYLAAGTIVDLILSYARGKNEMPPYVCSCQQLGLALISHAKTPESWLEIEVGHIHRRRPAVLRAETLRKISIF